jgi:hypothetical protein
MKWRNLFLAVALSTAALADQSGNVTLTGAISSVGGDREDGHSPKCDATVRLRHLFRLIPRAVPL